jgi:DASH complex subunit DAM1
MDWSRPSTPHRRSASVTSNGHYEIDPSSLPLDALLGPKAIVELSDSMATLDMNMQHLLAVHNSLASFNESFASFFHSMKMNAWCVEFSESPSTESLKYDRSELDFEDKENEEPIYKKNNPDATYMTDASFLDEPEQTPPMRLLTTTGSASSVRTVGSARSASSNSSRGSRIPQPASRFERPASAGTRDAGRAMTSHVRTPATGVVPKTVPRTASRPVRQPGSHINRNRIPPRTVTR